MSRMQVASAMTMGAVGTLHYTAPEMMRSHHYNEKVRIILVI